MSSIAQTVPSCYTNQSSASPSPPDSSIKEENADRLGVQLKQVTKNRIQGMLDKHVVEEFHYAKKPMIIVGVVTLLLTVSQGLVMTNVFRNEDGDRNTLWFEFALWLIAVLLDVTALQRVFCDAKDGRKTVRIFHFSLQFLAAGIIVALVRKYRDVVFLLGVCLAIAAMYLIFSMGSLKMMMAQKKKNQVHAINETPTLDILLESIQDDEELRMLIIEQMKKDERIYTFLTKLAEYQAFFNSIHELVKKAKSADQQSIQPMLQVLEQAKEMWEIKNQISEEIQIQMQMKGRMEQVFSMLPSPNNRSNDNNQNDDLERLFKLVNTSNVGSSAEYSQLKQRLLNQQHSQQNWVKTASDQYKLKQDMAYDLQQAHRFIQTMSANRDKIQQTVEFFQENNIIQITESICQAVQEKLPQLTQMAAHDFSELQQLISTLHPTKDDILITPGSVDMQDQV